MGRRNSNESLFEQIAVHSGFCVFPPRSIRINAPVADKCGIVRKTVTTPDWYVVDQKSGREVHVEITDSSGCTPHKDAQRRVIEKAKVLNYVVITGDQIQQLSILSSDERRQLLSQYLFSLNTE